MSPCHEIDFCTILKLLSCLTYIFLVAFNLTRVDFHKGTMVSMLSCIWWLAWQDHTKCNIDILHKKPLWRKSQCPGCGCSLLPLILCICGINWPTVEEYDYQIQNPFAVMVSCRLELLLGTALFLTMIWIFSKKLLWSVIQQNTNINSNELIWSSRCNPSWVPVVESLSQWFTWETFKLSFLEYLNQTPHINTKYKYQQALCRIPKS